MKTMSRMLGTCLISLFFAGVTMAQSLDQQFLEETNPSVSMRVAQVAKAVPISLEQQRQIGQLYQREDSLLKAAVSRKAKSEEVAAIRQQTLNTFPSILNEKQYYQYYTYVTQLYAQTDKNTVVKEQQNFIEAKIARLDSIKPLPAKVKEGIKTVFARLCEAQMGISLESYFWDVMHSQVKEEIYYAKFYQQDIATAATANAAYYTRWHVTQYRISDKCRKELNTLLLEKHTRIGVLNFASPGTSPAKEKQFAQLNAKYDSLAMRLLVFDGKIKLSSLFSLATANRDELKLTDQQANQLYAQALTLYYAQTKQAVDAWKVERKQCRSILNEDQYTQLLVLKNAAPAKQEAKKQWQQMQAKKLCQGLDSTIAIEQMRSHLLTVLITKDYFEDEKATQEANLKALQAMAPEPMRRLKSQDKTAKAAPAQAYRGTFLW